LILILILIKPMIPKNANIAHIHLFACEIDC
jgi:hypothetical protein